MYSIISLSQSSRRDPKRCASDKAGHQANLPSKFQNKTSDAASSQHQLSEISHETTNWFSIAIFALTFFTSIQLGTAFASLKPDAPAKEKSALATRRIALVIPQTTPHIPKSTPTIPKINPPMLGKRFDILGSIAFKTQTNKFASEWAGVLKRVQIERPFYNACEKASADCPAALMKWRNELNMLRPLPRLVQLRRLNRFVNHLAAYSDDNVTFGSRDHWASPLEFLKGRGDCEDFAIFKFFGLLELGFENDQLRIAMVKDRRRNLLHAVLTVEIAGETYVLDNLNNQVRSHERLLNYLPRSSFNLKAQWAHIVTGQIRSQFQYHMARKFHNEDKPRHAMDKSLDPKISRESNFHTCRDCKLKPTES